MSTPLMPCLFTSVHHCTFIMKRGLLWVTLGPTFFRVSTFILITYSRNSIEEALKANGSFIFFIRGLKFTYSCLLIYSSCNLCVQLQGRQLWSSVGRSVHHFGPDWNILVTVWWIAVTFGEHIHGSQNMHPHQGTVSLCPNTWWMTKYLQYCLSVHYIWTGSSITQCRAGTDVLVCKNTDVERLRECSCLTAVEC